MQFCRDLKSVVTFTSIPSNLEKLTGTEKKIVFSNSVGKVLKIGSSTFPFVKDAQFSDRRYFYKISGLAYI